VSVQYLLVMPKGAARSSGYNVFPSGIAYVSAAMKQAGMDVVTANLEYCNGTTEQALKKLILDNEIDIVCTSGLSRDYWRVKDVVDTAKKAKPVVTVVGGGIITGDPDAAMGALGCDYGIVGEGEHALTRFSQWLVNMDDRGSIIHGESIADLDTIPFPDYDGFSFNDYLNDINSEAAYIIASRGCPYGCTFCARPGSRKYRQRSLDNVFEEIDLLVHGHGLKHLIISDELFAVQRDRVLEFCERIVPYQITWALQLRVTDVDAPLLHTMKSAGCKCVSYGVESADDRILQSMRKKITLVDIEKALRETREADIDIQGGLIFGDTKETEETANNSLQWWERHREYGLELNMINVFPGTGLYTGAVERGIITDRIKYLQDGCPLTNVSQMTDSQYRDLASRIYAMNTSAKYAPERLECKPRQGLDGVDTAVIFYCNKCGTEIRFVSDSFHVKRILCPTCNQRHYVDPFRGSLVDAGSPLTARLHFGGYEKVALWGAGELCMKMIEYMGFHASSFVIVDSSKSRQGCTLCGKEIHDPEIIRRDGISTVIVTVLPRREEILESLRDYGSVGRVYVPCIILSCKNLTMGFELAMLRIGKVLAPGHGFNSERSQRAENGGRP